MVTQGDILDLAKHNAVVARVVDLWKSGNLSWEEAMMLSVKVLTNQVDVLLSNASGPKHCCPSAHMSSEELNPNHPVTEAVRDQWPMITALVMHTVGLKSVMLTTKEMLEFPTSLAIAIYSKPEDNSILLKLISRKEAERLAKEEGGIQA